MKKNQIQKKKLSLDSTTVRRLTDQALAGIVGALPISQVTHRSCVSLCWCETDDC